MGVFWDTTHTQNPNRGFTAAKESPAGLAVMPQCAQRLNGYWHYGSVFGRRVCVRITSAHALTAFH